MNKSTVGNAARRFRVLSRLIVSSVEKVKEINKAVFAPHNFDMTENEFNNQNYYPQSYIDVNGPYVLQLG